MRMYTITAKRFVSDHFTQIMSNTLDNLLIINVIVIAAIFQTHSLFFSNK